MAFVRRLLNEIYNFAALKPLKKINDQKNLLIFAGEFFAS